MRKYLGYAIYMGLSLLFLGPIFITPFLAQSFPQAFQFLQAAYAPTCHQLAVRSLCYFQNHADDNSSASPSNSYVGIGGGSIGDCEQPGTSVIGREQIVDDHGILGYKFPVCARDVAIYGAMILGGILFAFLRKVDDKVAPPFIYFALALVPIALDGGTQLIGLRTSTNELRIITGFIAGIAVPFYVIPMLNMFVLGKDKKAEASTKSSSDKSRTPSKRSQS